MPRRSLPIAAALLLLVLHAVHAQELPVPTLTSHVTDMAEILTPEQRLELEIELQRYEDTTSNQFAVLIIPSLRGESLEEYSLRVAEANKLGTAEKDNGLLLLVAIEERKIRIEVGYGLEGAIPDVTTALVRENEITPRFRQGDYYGGLQAGLRALMQAAAGEYRAAPRDQAPEGIGLMGIIVAVIVFIIVLRIFRGGGGGRGGRRMGGSIIPWIIASQMSSWGRGGGGGWSSGGGGFGGGGGGWSGGGGGSFGGGGSSGGW